MSEKRFKLAYEKGNEAIFEDLDPPYPRRMTNKEVERKLNEQDEKIKELEKENDTLRMITGKELFKEISNLKEDIQQLEKKNKEAHHSHILANGFIIEKGLIKEFIKWSKEND